CAEFTAVFSICTSTFLVLFLLSWYGDPRDLHSFPTRRSSDLILTVQGDKDELVPVAMVRELVSSFDGAGLTSKYIEIPDGDHVRVIARNPELMEEIFDFLAAHSR